MSNEMSEKETEQLKKKVLAWMRNNFREHVDGSCNELNMTTLSESAADNFNLYEDEVDYTIPEWVFELATQVKVR
jgi:hypothetical protein